MTDIVLVDLDSTLADTRQRRHLCPTVDPTKTWTDYAMGCPDDEPIAGTVALVRALYKRGYGIHIVSHRDRAALDLTVDWLIRHDIPHHAVALNQHKVSYLMALREAGAEVVLAIDDDCDVAAAYEAVDCPVVCVNPRYSHRP